VALHTDIPCLCSSQASALSWLWALALLPLPHVTLNNVGNIHLLRNDTIGALPFYQRAVKANPLNPTAWYNLGYIYESRGELRRAIRYYQQFINVAEGPWAGDVLKVQSHLSMRYGVHLKREPFDPSIKP